MRPEHWLARIAEFLYALRIKLCRSSIYPRLYALATWLDEWVILVRPCLPHRFALLAILQSTLGSQIAYRSLRRKTLEEVTARMQSIGLVPTDKTSVRVKLGTLDKPDNFLKAERMVSEARKVLGLAKSIVECSPAKSLDRTECVIVTIWGKKYTYICCSHELRADSDE